MQNPQNTQMGNSPDNRKKSPETTILPEGTEEFIIQALVEIETQKGKDPKFKTFLEELKINPNRLLVAVFCKRATTMATTKEISAWLKIPENTIRKTYETINSLLSRFWSMPNNRQQTDYSYYLVTHERQEPQQSVPTIILTQTQYKILTRLTENLSYIAISNEITITPKTIQVYVERIITKLTDHGLSADSREEIIKLWYEGKVNFIQEEPTQLEHETSNSTENTTESRTAKEIYDSLPVKQIRIGEVIGDQESYQGYLDDEKNVIYQLRIDKFNQKLILTVTNNHLKTAIRLFCIESGGSISNIAIFKGQEYKKRINYNPQELSKLVLNYKIYIPDTHLVLTKQISD